jgi:hypothetical protein
MRLLTLGMIVISIISCGAQAQNFPTSDPEALSLAARSISVLTGKFPVTDVTLTGTGTWNTRDGGNFKLSALGNGESRMDLTSSSGITTVIRDMQSGVPLGKWEIDSTRSGNFASQNCWTDAVWFFPALGSLAQNSNAILTYVGQEFRNGDAVYHLHSHIYQRGKSSVPGVQELSAMDFYLDSRTFLPVATTFYAHPDNDAHTNLLVEIDFSNYTRIKGILVPSHIQRRQQGTLTLDLDVVSVSINSGTQLSLFQIK